MTDIFIMFAIASFICSVVVAEQAIILAKKNNRLKDKINCMEYEQLKQRAELNYVISNLKKEVESLEMNSNIFKEDDGK